MQMEAHEGVLRLGGSLTVNTLTASQLNAFRQRLDDGIDTIDLSSVREADSACVALLVDALRDKQKTQQTLRFTGLPDGLVQLAYLYEVDKWIGS